MIIVRLHDVRIGEALYVIGVLIAHAIAMERKNNLDDVFSALRWITELQLEQWQKRK